MEITKGDIEITFKSGTKMTLTQEEYNELKEYFAKSEALYYPPNVRMANSAMENY